MCALPHEHKVLGMYVVALVATACVWLAWVANVILARWRDGKVSFKGPEHDAGGRTCRSARARAL
jgi:hypothetical protein